MEQIFSLWEMKEIVHEMWQRCLDNGDIYKPLVILQVFSTCASGLGLDADDCGPVDKNKVLICVYNIYKILLSIYITYLYNI